MEAVKKYWFVVVVVVVVIAIYVAVKKGVLNFFGGPGTDQIMKEELSKIQYVKKNLSINANDAILISQQLYMAMDQWGTDEETILNLLADLNRDDLLLVIQTFGLKEYDGQQGVHDLATSYLTGKNLNLQGWLKAELGGKDLDQVKAFFEKNNIPF